MLLSKENLDGQLVEESLEGQLVDCFVGVSFGFPPIVVRNVGDGSTNLIYFRLYLTLEQTHYAIASWTQLQHCDEPEYNLAYTALTSPMVLHPKMSFVLQGGHWDRPKKGSCAALLKVYYGEPEPRIVKFSINFK